MMATCLGGRFHSRDCTIQCPPFEGFFMHFIVAIFVELTRFHQNLITDGFDRTENNANNPQLLSSGELGFDNAFRSVTIV